jgi:hypothetical protein
MSDRFAFLVFAIALFPMGIYAAINSKAAKKGNAGVPGFPKTGFAKMPVWFFRLVGIATVGMSGFFRS